MVDGAELSKGMVEEKIGDGANVCGENVLSLVRKVVLLSSLQDVTWTGCGEAPFNEWWRKGLMWLGDRGRILTDIVLRHSWIVPNLQSLRRDQMVMWRDGASGYSSSFEMAEES